MPSRTCCTSTSHSHLQPALKSIKFSLTWHLHCSTRHLRVWSYSIMASSLPSKPLLFKDHCGVMSSPIIHSQWPSRAQRLLHYQRLLILGNGIVLSSFVEQSLPTRTTLWLWVKELSITSQRTSGQWGVAR